MKNKIMGRHTRRKAAAAALAFALAASLAAPQALAEGQDPAAEAAAQSEAAAKAAAESEAKAAEEAAAKAAAEAAAKAEAEAKAAAEAAAAAESEAAARAAAEAAAKAAAEAEAQAQAASEAAARAESEAASEAAAQAAAEAEAAQQAASEAAASEAETAAKEAATDAATEAGATEGQAAEGTEAQTEGTEAARTNKVRLEATEGVKLFVDGKELKEPGTATEEGLYAFEAEAKDGELAFTVEVPDGYEIKEVKDGKGKDVRENKKTEEEDDYILEGIADDSTVVAIEAAPEEAAVDAGYVKVVNRLSAPSLGEDERFLFVVADSGGFVVAQEVMTVEADDADRTEEAVVGPLPYGTYTVTESTMEGYGTSYPGGQTVEVTEANATKGAAAELAVENSHLQAYGSIVVSQEWAEGTEPLESVEVNILRDGEAYGTVALGGANGWKVDYPAERINFGEGKLYAYTLEEELPEGYVATYSPSAELEFVGNVAEAVVTGTDVSILEVTEGTEEVAEAAPQELSYEDGEVSVDVELAADAGIPEGAEVKVEKLTSGEAYEAAKEELDSRAGEAGEAEYAVYRVYLELDGEEIEVPDGAAKVSLQLKEAAPEGAEQTVLRIKDTGAGRLVQDVTDEAVAEAAPEE